MELIENKDKCCACGACIELCPVKAIVFLQDEYGFLYPSIDEDKCIDCKLCINRCTYKSEANDKSMKPLTAYAAASTDADTMASSSGGVFAGIASSILCNNGIVCGSALLKESDLINVRHIIVSKEDELHVLKGSKYVYSKSHLVFSDIENNLKTGKLVLFSGTPCQIVGLKSYLGKEYSNLYTIDIVCHGVPSLSFFQDYLKYVEEKEDIEVLDYKFRDKTQGWKLYGKMKFRNRNNELCEEYFDPEGSSYYQLFLDSLTYRINCYSCPYAGSHRPGDITIGDFWGIEVTRPDLLKTNRGPFDEKKGISCMLINNQHGANLIREYGQTISKSEVKLESIIRYNGQLNHPSILKLERNDIMNEYIKGYEYVEDWYQKRLKIVKVKRAMKALIPKSIKKLRRKILDVK